MFGSSLSSHLANFQLPSGIAWPLQVCVSRLVTLGLEEEGLFRLAAGNGKVRRMSILTMFHHNRLYECLFKLKTIL